MATIKQSRRSETPIDVEWKEFAMRTVWNGRYTCSEEVPTPDEVFALEISQANHDYNLRFKPKNGRIVRTVSQELIPNFHKRRKAGEILPSTNYERLEYYEFDSSWYLGYNHLDYRYGACNNAPHRQSMSYDFGFKRAEVPANISFYALSDESLENSLMTEAKAKLHSIGWDVLTFASEFHKTLAMLGGLKERLLQTVIKITNAVKADIRAYKKHKRIPPWAKRDKEFRIPRTPKALWEAFQNAWLEYRFGWRILYYDMQSLNDWFLNRKEKERLVVGRSSEKRSVTITSGDRTSVYEQAWSVGYPGMLDPEKLGYLNPLNTAWDIMPWSLVVDWFFSVQESILAHTGAPQNVKALGHASFLTYRSFGIHTFQPLQMGAGMLNTRCDPFICHSERVHRRPIGDPKITFPSWAGGPSGYQWLDLGTLMGPLYKALTSK